MPAKFSFDECVPCPAMERLQDRIAKTRVYPPDLVFAHLVKKLKQGVLDDEWIPQVALEGGWLIITSDGGKSKSRGGKLPELCVEYKVSHLIFSPAFHSLTSNDKVVKLESVFQHILDLSQKIDGTRGDLVYKPTDKGFSLNLVYDKSTPCRE